MERQSGKTTEAFVEFVNMDEAVKAVNQYEMNRAQGRAGKLGDRRVSLQVSSQDELMRQLFPKTKNVTWNGAMPLIHPAEYGKTGFDGFLSREELVALVKHVESPHKVGSRCCRKSVSPVLICCSLRTARLALSVRLSFLSAL